MSEEGSPQPPEPSQTAARPLPSPPGSRPKWLSAIAISAMVLGGLFGCCGVTTLGGQVMNRAMNPMMGKMMTGDPESPAAREFMERTSAAQARIFPFALTTGLLALLHSIALVVAGIMAYNGRASGRGVLALVCLVGIGIELINGGISIYMTRETDALTAEAMKATFAAQPAEPTPEQKQAHEMGQKFASGAARAGSILGMLMIVFIFAIKTGYYVATALYLRRKDVVDFFEAPRSTAAA